MSLQVRGSIYHFKEIADHYTGVSIKIEVAYKFEWSNQLYQQGTVSPFFLGGGGGGRGSGCTMPQKILKF